MAWRQIWTQDSLSTMLTTPPSWPLQNNIFKNCWYEYYFTLTTFIETQTHTQQEQQQQAQTHVTWMHTASRGQYCWVGICLIEVSRRTLMNYTDYSIISPIIHQPCRLIHQYGVCIYSSRYPEETNHHRGAVRWGDIHPAGSKLHNTGVYLVLLS